MHDRAIGVVAFVAALTVAGCSPARDGDEAGKPAADADEAAGTPEASEIAEEPPAPPAGDETTASKEAEVNDPELTTTDSGLKYKDLSAGSGVEAQRGQTAVVHYTGWLVDGTKFDSSVDRGEPFEFPVGGGRVIKGWDEGVAGMKTGGKRRLVIPADLGYGATGAGGVIPPDATLIFEVELLEVKPA